MRQIPATIDSGQPVVVKYKKTTNKLLKTIENAKYGHNEITGINAYSVYITVDYDRTNASALASTYTTTSCTYTYKD